MDKKVSSLNYIVWVSFFWRLQEKTGHLSSCLHFCLSLMSEVKWMLFWISLLMTFKSGAYLIRSTRWALLLAFPRLHFSALEGTTPAPPGIDRSATASSCFELRQLVDWVAVDTKVPPPPPPTGCWYSRSDDWQFCTGVIRSGFDGKLFSRVFSFKTAL